MNYRILIIGAGEIGRAIKKILRKKKYQIEFWDKKPALVPRQGKFDKLVSQADFVFLCIPSFAFSDVLEKMKLSLRKSTVVVSLAKGIEQKSLKTTDRLMQDLLPKGQGFSLLSGPMLAEELLIGLSGSAVAASRSRVVAKKVKKIFNGTDLAVETSTDLHGVAVAGVLKNIYVLALGIADELRLGANARGRLVMLSIDEIGRIVKQAGGKPGTSLSTAGIADYVATGTSGFSSNYEFGRKVVRQRESGISCEGAVSLKPLLKLLGTKHKQYVVLTALKKVVLGKQDAKKTFKKLLQKS